MFSVQSEHYSCVSKSHRRLLSSFEQLYGSTSNALMLDIVQSLFPLLTHKLSSLHRPTVLAALDLIAKLAANTENTAFFEKSPDKLFFKLVGSRHKFDNSVPISHI